MIGFTGATLDRADHLRLQPERVAALAASPDARLLELDALDPVLDGAGRLIWLANGAVVAEPEFIFLGLDDGSPLFAPLRPVAAVPPGWSVFRLMSVMAPADLALWGTARSLLAWHARHGFCAVCGAATLPFRAGWGRKCRGCAAEHFPRVDPVVIMLAEHDDRLLLGRQPLYPPGRYSALAGFVEPGESIEEAVVRECLEEAGIRVRAVRYLASQPWPFPGQLMIACIAQAKDDRLVIDRTELDDARWFTRADIAAAMAGDPGAPFLPPPPFAIAHTLLADWLAPRRDRL